MILVDTSIVIQWIRVPALPLQATIRRNDGAICGVTIGEVALVPSLDLFQP